MANVDGNTEFAKLFVSVVIPVISEAAANAGMRDASPLMSGISNST